MESTAERRHAAQHRHIPCIVCSASATYLNANGEWVCDAHRVTDPTPASTL